MQAVASSYCKQLQEEGSKRGQAGKWEAIQQAATTPQGWLHETIDAPFTGGRDARRWTVEVAAPHPPRPATPYTAPRLACRGSGSTRWASTRQPRASTARRRDPRRARARRGRLAPSVRTRCRHHRRSAAARAGKRAGRSGRVLRRRGVSLELGRLS